MACELINSHAIYNCNTNIQTDVNAFYLKIVSFFAEGLNRKYYNCC